MKFNEFLKKDVENLSCMCSSSDEANEYLFLGSHDGILYCLDVAMVSIVAQTDLSQRVSIENANIIAICSSQIKDSVHFVLCLSDTG